jgi:hypothetical protein
VYTSASITYDTYKPSCPSPKALYLRPFNLEIEKGEVSGEFETARDLVLPLLKLAPVPGLDGEALVAEPLDGEGLGHDLQRPARRVISHNLMNTIQVLLWTVVCIFSSKFRGSVLFKKPNKEIEEIKKSVLLLPFFF